MRSSKIVPLCVSAILATALASVRPAAAMPEFLELFTNEYPSVVGTRLDSCSVCHLIPPRRNDYGTDYNLAGRRFSAIEAVDSDEDGFDNLEEILALTFPGDPNDNVNSTPEPTSTHTPLPTATHTPTPMDTATPTRTNTPRNTPTLVPGPCWGDCNGNGAVAINELVISVNIALGRADVSSCEIVDDDGNGEVAINELIRAVGRALNGCPP